MSDQKIYLSVHEYMDAIFEGKTPSKEEILGARKSFRKQYQQQYQRTYRKKYVQISFRLSNKKYGELKEIAEDQKIKVTTLVKQRALQNKANDSMDIKILISELLDEIEEHIYQKRVIDLTGIVKQLEVIEAML